jgi:mandelate racemase
MSIPDLTIREIRARPVVAPLPRPIRTASGDVLDAPLLLIDVLTDAGVTGRAYAFAYTPLTLRSLAQFARDIAPELIGKSVSPRADAADGEASQAGRLAGIRRHGHRHSR